MTVYTGFTEGMRCRIHRAAWRSNTLELASLLGTRQELTTITAALNKTSPASLDIMADREYVGSFTRSHKTNKPPVVYHRLIEPTSYAGICQAVIWSSNLEHDHEGGTTIAFGRTRRELRRAAYLHLNRRSSVPIREEWIRWLLTRMTEDKYAAPLETINCQAVQFTTISDLYIANQITEFIEEGRPA